MQNLNIFFKFPIKCFINQFLYTPFYAFFVQKVILKVELFKNQIFMNKNYLYIFVNK